MRGIIFQWKATNYGVINKAHFIYNLFEKLVAEKVTILNFALPRSALQSF